MKLCFATNNKHKLEEVKLAVSNHFDILSLQEIGHTEDLPETTPTLEGNALQKAEHVYTLYKIPCFADDTGLEVEALQGAPGVYSARYAGDQKNSDDNINLLLKNLENVQNRKARFRTVIALVGLGEPRLFEGIIEGQITTIRRGNQGFGYDPVFRPDGSRKTFAEMTIEEKNQLSHRALATQKLISFLTSAFKTS
jgi:XTP/dITP diphosphohydrolase